MLKRLKIYGPFFRPIRKQLILGPICKLIEAIIELFLPLIMADLIDRGANGMAPAAVYRSTALMLGLVVAGLLFSFSCQYMASRASQGFGTALRNGLFRRLMELTPEQADRFGSGSLLNRLTVDSNRMQVGVAMAIRLLTRAPFLCLGGLIMALRVNARLALILLACIPLAALVLVLVMRQTVKVHKLAQKGLDKLALLIQDNLSGVRVIRAFDKEKREQDLFAEKNKDWEKTVVRAGKVAAAVNPLSVLIFNMGIMALLYLGGGEMATGSLSRGELIALINYFGQIVLAMIVVANLMLTFSAAFTAADRVGELLRLPVESPLQSNYAADLPAAVVTPTRRQGAAKEQGPVNRRGPMAGYFSYRSQAEVEGQRNRRAAAFADPLFKGGWKLVFKDVSYAYPGSPEPAVADLSLELEDGESLGIIGGTGSGKSTLALLLAGFVEPTSGRLELLDRAGGRTRVADLQEKLGHRFIRLVFQKAGLFSGTVRSNLLLGAEGDDWSDEELWKSLKIAQADRFVREDAAGLDRRVERGGVNFSGGQRQRLAIASALVGQPQVLILDDCSSGLDYATDAALYRALREQKIAGGNLVIISQRVYSVARADRILVLDQGRPVGLGSHRALLESCPIYREICASQSEAEGES